MLKYVVEKGYVTVDGASLTVTKVDEESFSVMLVSYTQEKVVTAAKKEGEEVNVEVDMVGKYVEVCHTYSNFWLIDEIVFFFL